MRTETDRERQSAQALISANRTRLAMSKWRRVTASMEPAEAADRLAELLTDDQALNSDLGSMTAIYALLSIHRVGDHRASEMLRRAAIVSADRRLRDLTVRQRVVLAFQLYEARPVAPASVPVHVFKQRFEHLQATEQMTHVDLAEILGWHTKKGHADGERVKRTFAEKAQTSRGRRYRRERINYDLAVRLCDALGLDYTEIGV